MVADGLVRRAGWPMLVLAGIGALLSVQSAFGTWLSEGVTVAPEVREQARHGIGYFGARSVGFGLGLALLAVLVGLAVSGRWRRPLSLAALAVAGLLVADAAWVFAALARVQSGAAAEVVRIRDSYDGLPTEVGFHVSSPGLYAGLAATFLFVLVAAQLLWPGPAVLAVIGAVAGVVAIVLPWTRLWYVDDRNPGVPFETTAFWVPTFGVEGVLLVVELAVLVALAWLCLRAPGYARWRWALGLAGVAGLLVLSVQVREVANQEDAFRLGERVSEVLAVSSTGAGPLLALGGVLLAIAGLRAWWRGREEVLPAGADDSWLPERLRQRQ